LIRSSIGWNVDRMRAVVSVTSDISAKEGGGDRPFHRGEKKAIKKNSSPMGTVAISDEKERNRFDLGEERGSPFRSREEEPNPGQADVLITIFPSPIWGKKRKKGGGKGSCCDHTMEKKKKERQCL